MFNFVIMNETSWSWSEGSNCGLSLKMVEFSFLSSRSLLSAVISRNEECGIKINNVNKLLQKEGEESSPGLEYFNCDDTSNYPHTMTWTNPINIPAHTLCS